MKIQDLINYASQKNLRTYDGDEMKGIVIRDSSPKVYWYRCYDDGTLFFAYTYNMNTGARKNSISESLSALRFEQKVEGNEK